MDEKDFYSAYIAVIAAISSDTGVETIMMFDEAVKKEHFIEFLRRLRTINGERRVHCFLDNLKVHKAPEVNQLWAELNIVPIWNVPYHCQFQPIELVFSQVKRTYK